MKYYVDTCIFLNVWNKEVGSNSRKPFYKTSEQFIIEKSELLISEAIIRELEIKTKRNDWKSKLRRMDFEILKVTPNMKREARRIESEEAFNISFYDIIHMLFAQQKNAVLITRDRGLITLCERHGVRAGRPEAYQYH